MTIPKCDRDEIIQSAMDFTDLLNKFTQECRTLNLADQDERAYIADYATSILDTLKSIGEHGDSEIATVLGVIPVSVDESGARREMRRIFEQYAVIEKPMWRPSK